MNSAHKREQKRNDDALENGAWQQWILYSLRSVDTMPAETSITYPCTTLHLCIGGC